ncbi:MAG: hypothetical protein HPY50_04855 [Firmicutes bacterium]|nr:hypothetical protein [Bacillota bacterium]
MERGGKGIRGVKGIKGIEENEEAKAVRAGRIERAVFRYIEHELFRYDATIDDILEIREEIIEEEYAPEVKVSGGQLNDATRRRATRLATDAVLIRMTRVVVAIDRALDRLGDRHRLLFELRYRRLLQWPQICLEMSISERTFFRMRRELVLMVGSELGLI